MAGVVAVGFLVRHEANIPMTATGAEIGYVAAYRKRDRDGVRVGGGFEGTGFALREWQREHDGGCGKSKSSTTNKRWIHAGTSSFVSGGVKCRLKNSA